MLDPFYSVKEKRKRRIVVFVQEPYIITIWYHPGLLVRRVSTKVVRDCQTQHPRFETHGSRKGDLSINS
jgi:hypothetical protein